MKTLKRHPALVLLGAVALGLGIGALLKAFVIEEEPGQDLALIQVSEEDLRLAEEELAAAVEADPNPGQPGGLEPILKRIPLNEDLVNRIMPGGKRSRTWDPHCYFHSNPNRKQWKDWPEHPEGGYHVRSNSLGMRMEAEPMDPPPDLRVVLVGDSHMAGVCSFDECTAGRLRSLLAGANPDRTVEVLNLSEGAYSFYHYLGALERALALGLEPDVFVPVVYGGNDFLAVFLWHFFTGTRRVRNEPEAERRKVEAARNYSTAMGQALNAVDYFHAGGQEEVDLALLMAEQAIREIERLCGIHGIELIFAYLPAPHEVEGAADLTTIESGLALLELEPGTLALTGQMGDRFMELLQAHGIQGVDLRTTFAGTKEHLYWSRDLHLNLLGHDLTARALAPLVEASHARLIEKR